MSSFTDEALLKQRQQLREMAQGFRQAQVLLTCVELRVFEVLHGRAVRSRHFCPANVVSN